MVNDNLFLLIAGQPAAGKSTFCRYLASHHEFVAYELENYPSGWPDPELKTTWDASRFEFVSVLRHRHRCVVLEWGFPPSCRPIVEELALAGARLVWFDADEAAARRVFVDRGGVDLESFERQVRAIRESGLPSGLHAIVLRTLWPDGTHKSADHILAELRQSIQGTE